MNGNRLPTYMYIKIFLRKCQTKGGIWRKKTIFDYLAIIKNGKQVIKQAISLFVEGAQQFDDGYNGVITYIMATESANAYREEMRKEKRSNQFKNSIISFTEQEEFLKNTRKRADGRWEWRKYSNGKTYDIIKPTQKELFSAVKKLKQSLKQNKEILPTPVIVQQKRYTLIDWCYYWVETYKNNNRIKQSTINDIKGYFRNHIQNSYLANVYITDLTTDMLQQFFNQKKPSRTKEIITIYLKAALKKARGLNLIKTDLFAEFVSDVKQNNVDPPFTYDEQVKILENLKGTDIECAIMFYLITGVRRNEKPQSKDELLNALDVENNLLKIRSEKKRNNRVVYRYIDLSSAATEYIKTNAEAICKHPNGQIYREFAKLLKRLNIKGKLHTLRHTFTTNHFYLRNPDKLISSWLGHETVEITQKVYMYIDRSITKEKIQNLYGDLYYLLK